MVQNYQILKNVFRKDNFPGFYLLPHHSVETSAAHVLLLRSRAEAKQKDVQTIATAKQQEILEARSFFFTALRCMDLHTRLFCLIPKSSLPPC